MEVNGGRINGNGLGEDEMLHKYISKNNNNNRDSSSRRPIREYLMGVKRKNNRGVSEKISPVIMLVHYSILLG